MNSSLKSVFALALLAALGAGSMLSPQSAQAKEDYSCTSCKKKKKKNGGRHLASLAPVKPVTQGELMLSSVKSKQPGFLSQSQPRSGLRLAGVCRDSRGITHTSTQKGYESCLDGQISRSGSVDNSLGPSQRQAGVGITIK